MGLKMTVEQCRALAIYVASRHGSMFEVFTPFDHWPCIRVLKAGGKNMKKHLMTTLAAVAMLAIGCKQSVETASEKFNALPKPVQTTVRAAAPNQEITAVDHDRTDGMDQYEITIKQGDQSQKMIVAADGRVIRSDLAQGGPGMLDKAVTRVTGAGAVGTKFSSLPEKVQSTIQKSAPETEIVDIERHEDNGRVYYEVEFKDQGKNPTIQVAEDGTLIQSLAK